MCAKLHDMSEKFDEFLFKNWTVKCFVCLKIVLKRLNFACESAFGIQKLAKNGLI